VTSTNFFLRVFDDYCTAGGGGGGGPRGSCARPLDGGWVGAYGRLRAPCVASRTATASDSVAELSARQGHRELAGRRMRAVAGNGLRQKRSKALGGTGSLPVLASGHSERVTSPAGGSRSTRRVACLAVVRGNRGAGQGRQVRSPTRCMRIAETALAVPSTGRKSYRALQGISYVRVEWPRRAARTATQSRGGGAVGRLNSLAEVGKAAVAERPGPTRRRFSSRGAEATPGPGLNRARCRNWLWASSRRWIS